MSRLLPSDAAAMALRQSAAASITAMRTGLDDLRATPTKGGLRAVRAAATTAGDAVARLLRHAGAADGSGPQTVAGGPFAVGPSTAQPATLAALAALTALLRAMRGSADPDRRRPDCGRPRG